MDLISLESKFDHLFAGHHEELILVVENHTERRNVRLEHRQVASVGIEDLDALDITNINATFAVNRNGARRSNLTRLVPRSTKTIYKLPFGSEFENSAVESSQSVDVAQTVNGHTCV
jgi:hypothetical protein